MFDYKEFGSRLRNLRKSIGKTQQEIADGFCINRSTYAYYECGKTFPCPDLLIEICDYYEISIEWLLGRVKTLPNRLKIKNEISLENMSFLPNNRA